MVLGPRPKRRSYAVYVTPTKRNTHQSQARDAFEKDWGGRFLARCCYRTKGGHCRTTELQVQPAFIFQHFGPEMAALLVREAELDSCESTSGYYSVHDDTIDHKAPTMITFDDSDITHVKFFRPQTQQEAGKTGKQRKDNPVREEGFYGINESNPGKIVGLSYDWVAYHCSPAFADNLKKKYKSGGFCWWSLLGIIALDPLCSFFFGCSVTEGGLWYWVVLGGGGGGFFMMLP